MKPRLILKFFRIFHQSSMKTYLKWLILYFLLLSLAAKSGEPLEEEKEAFDDAEKGKLAPSNEVTNVQVTKTPEKKVEAETKPETEENKEEKKSNGAHTPV